MKNYCFDFIFYSTFFQNRAIIFNIVLAKTITHSLIKNIYITFKVIVQLIQNNHTIRFELDNSPLMVKYFFFLTLS